jgi:hypothetical protein
MRISQQRMRKVVTGTAMVVAAPLILLSYLVGGDAVMTDTTAFVGKTIEYGRNRAIGSIILGAVYFPAAVIAVMGLVHLLRERKTNLGLVGGGLAIVGLVLMTTSIGMASVFLEVSLSEVATAEKVAILDATMESGSVVVLFAGSLLLAVGTAILGRALWTAGTVPKLSAVLFGLYGPVVVAGYATSTLALIIGGFVALGVALVPLGVVMLTESEDQWEHPPAFTGFHIAGGPREQTAV